MKISERYEVETTTESCLAQTRNNYEGNINLFKKTRKKVNKPFCDYCGYIDCVCKQNNPEGSQVSV